MSRGFPDPVPQSGGDVPRARATQPRPGDHAAAPATTSQGITGRSDLAEPAPAHRTGPRTCMSDLQPADPDPLFDPSVPHPARVYGYWLGGKDHYQADRDAAEEVIARRPQVVAGA